MTIIDANGVIELSEEEAEVINLHQNAKIIILRRPFRKFVILELKNLKKFYSKITNWPISNHQYG